MQICLDKSISLEIHMVFNMILNSDYIVNYYIITSIFPCSPTNKLKLFVISPRKEIEPKSINQNFRQ